MTWRERVARARENLRFANDDFTAWGSVNTCPAGEAVRAALGLECIYDQAGVYTRFLDAWQIGDGMSGAMLDNNFNRAENIIDKIEDLVLTIKREETK